MGYKLKNRRKLTEYMPHAFSAILTFCTLGLVAHTYSWIKNYGDFATQSFVMQAKAECVERIGNELNAHKSQEEIRLNRMEDKIDKIYQILLGQK